MGRTGYSNRYLGQIDSKGLLKWQMDRMRNPPRRAPNAPIVGVEPDLGLIRSDSGATRFTWVGHATLLVQIHGINVLTDPHWGKVASPTRIGPKRHQEPGMRFEDLPRIDHVLVSHNHYDHLDLGTVRRLMRGSSGVPTFHVPAGVDAWFARNVPGTILEGEGRNVIGYEWDDEIVLGDSASEPGSEIRLRFLAVQHWSARALHDRHRTLWGSWAVLAPRCTFWFSGDLGYSQDVKDIHASIGDVDVAAISIGAYAPRWFMKESHLDPEEAVKVMEDLEARSAVAVHWGTFEGLTDERLDEPPELLREHLARRGVDPERFAVPRHGQTLVWDGARLR